MKNIKLYCFVLLFTFLVFPIISFSQDLNPKDWRNLTGYWKFQDVKNLSKATVGNNLTLVGTHSWVKGPSYDDTAIRIGIGSYYKCKHNIAPNGGGDSVNRYTMMYDFKILNLKKWHTFFQTDTTNSNDGECFIRPNTGSRPGRIGVAATSYTNDSVLPNQWYRLVISVNNGNFYRYYLNGKLIMEGDTQDIDDRFALTPKVLFFADENQEDDSIDIASVAIFDTCLSTKDIEKIGTIDPCIAKPPVVKLGNDTILCQNSYLNLNVGTNFSKYQWSNGSTMPYTYFTGSSLGLGKKLVWVKIIDKNGCSGGDSITVNVITSPKAELGKDTSLCFGNKVILIGGTDISNNYIWKNIYTGKIISTASSVTVDTSGNYWLQVSSNYGCIAEDSMVVTFYENPPKPEIKTYGKTSVCEGDSVLLDGPPNYSIYSWSNNNSGKWIYVSSNSLISLKVTDKNGCSSPWSDSVKITVFKNPSVPKITLYPDSVFCTGDSVLLSVDNSFKDYKWNVGSTKSYIIVKQSGWFYVMVTDSNGCKSNYSKNVNIYELNRPEKQKIEITGNSEFCSGDSVILSTKTGFKGYLWNDSTAENIKTIYKSGNFKVKVLNDEGCYSYWSDEVNINVFKTPSKPSVITASNDTLICSLAAQNYKWFMNSMDLGASTKKIKAPQSGYYKIKVADNNCWSAFSDSVYYKLLAIFELKNKNFDILLYPNPTNDELKIVFIKNLKSKVSKYEIYEITGKKVIENSDFTSSDNEITIQTGFLSKGNYILNIYSGDEILRTKFEKR